MCYMYGIYMYAIADTSLSAFSFALVDREDGPAVHLHGIEPITKLTSALNKGVCACERLLHLSLSKLLSDGSIPEVKEPVARKEKAELNTSDGRMKLGGNISPLHNETHEHCKLPQCHCGTEGKEDRTRTRASLTTAVHSRHSSVRWRSEEQSP